MRRVALLLLLSATAEATEVSTLLRGRFGAERYGFVGATGSYTFGLSGPSTVAFSQFGGSALVEAGVDSVVTSLGSLIGLEGDLALGVARSELSSDGTAHDQRDPRDNEPPAAKIWLRLQVGLRAKASPVHLMLGDVGLRIGVVGGGALDIDGSRSFEVPALWNFGAQALLTGEGFSVMGTWVWAPPQGKEAVLSRHVTTLHVAVGPVMLGARWTFDVLAIVAVKAPQAQIPQSSHALGVFAGLIL